MAVADNLANAATRQLDTWATAFERRDWDALTAMFAPDHEFIDLRPIVGGGRLDRDGVIGGLRTVVDLGFTEVAVRPLAVRAARLAMTMHTYWSPDAEVAVVSVDTIDEAGRFVRSVVYDETDLTAAADALDDQYEGTLPDAERAVFALGRRGARAFATGDADGAEALVSPSFTLVDHRALGLGVVDRASVARTFEAVTDRGRGYTRYTSEVLRLTAAGQVARNLEVEENSVGGRIESDTVVMTLVAGGVFDRFEIFPADGGELAAARFDELLASRP